MSGDERRGTDGGEHPLDVEARFADIIARFHDGEPAPPPEDTAGPGDRGRPGSEDRSDVQTGQEEPAGPVGTGGGDGHGGWDSLADESATDWAARYEQAAREELAAHEEREARSAREARIHAEIDRAVDGPGNRFVPAEPPPLPRPADLPGRLAWAAVLLGPVALVLFALIWQAAPSWVVGTVVTAIVAGFGYLVWRLPRTHDRDDGGDGAIV